MYHFINAYTVLFAGESIEMSPGTFKVALLIRDWPFQSLQNSLLIVFESSSSEDIAACNVDSRSDTNNDLRWIKMNVNGVELYGQILEFAMIDGYKRYVNFGVQNINQITVIIPFFWYNVSLDPNFALLFDPSTNCHSSTHGLANPLAFLVLPIAAVLIAFGFAVFYHEKLEVLWKTKVLKRKVEVQVEM